MRIQGSDPLCEVILRGKVIFVDLLEEIMQRSKGHAFDIPMKILRHHGRDRRFSQGLIERVGNSCTRICRQSSGGLCHWFILSMRSRLTRQVGISASQVRHEDRDNKMFLELF